MLRRHAFSDDPNQNWQNEMVFDFAGKWADRNSPNEVFSFKDEDGFYHRIMTTRTNGRIYTFQIISPTPDERKVKGFFESIRIQGEKLDLMERISGVKPVAVIPGNNSSPPPADTGIGVGTDT